MKRFTLSVIMLLLLNGLSFAQMDQKDLPEFKVAGRLDYDSEGLLLLTDDGQLQQRISNPIRVSALKPNALAVEPSILNCRQLVDARQDLVERHGILVVDNLDLLQLGEPYHTTVAIN